MKKYSQKQIYNLLLKINQYEKNFKLKKSSGNRALRQGFFWLNMACLMFSIILFILGVYLSLQTLIVISLILLLICEGLLLVDVIIDILYSRKDIKYFFNEPVGILLRNANISARSAIEYLPELIAFEYDDLELARREITYEKDHFDKRTSILTGSLDKIGIFPSILATMVLLLTHLSNNKTFEFLQEHPEFQFLFYILIAVVVVFQLFSIFTNFISLKLSYLIQVLECTIKLKEGNNG